MAKSSKKSRNARSCVEETQEDGEHNEDQDDVMSDDDNVNNDGANKKRQGRPKNTGDDDEERSDDEDEDMEENDGEDDDEDEDMEDEDEDETEDTEMPASSNGKSPESPQAKKDMFLRSGKRKRRRSKETSGLTPPHSTGKRAKTTTTNKKQRASQTSTGQTTILNGGGRPAAAAAAAAAAGAGAASTALKTNGQNAVAAAAASPAGVPDPRRISYSGAGRAAATAAPALKPPPPAAMSQEDGEGNEELNEDVLLNQPFSGFAAAEPAAQAPTRSVASYFSCLTENVMTAVVGEGALAAVLTANERMTVIQQQEQQEADDGVEEQQRRGQNEPHEHQETQAVDDEGRETFVSKMTRWLQPYAGWITRLSIMMVLSVVLFALWPRLSGMADLIIPLDKDLILPTASPAALYLTDPTDGNVEPDPVVVDPPSEETAAWSKQFAEELTILQDAVKEYGMANDGVVSNFNDWVAAIQRLQNDVNHRQKEIDAQMKKLTDLQLMLLQDNQGSNLSHEERTVMQTLAQQVAGMPFITTSLVNLWEIPDSVDECAEMAHEEEEDGISPLTVSAETLEKQASDLAGRAQRTAKNFVEAPITKDRVRRWARSQITQALGGNRDAGRSIAELGRISSDEITASSGGRSDMALAPSGVVHAESISDIESTIQTFLEMNRADTTESLDHAALASGAVIIYGGRRGTSKSLVDDLPLVNRVASLAKLRFYGFGPEAALTPTYPASALGQCWSFRPPTVEEQVEQQKEFQRMDQDISVPDDFKRGSLGTLTVRFQAPVYVTSVVIEYPPDRLTNQISTSIQSFRVVGYEDSMATSKAWNLGSFFYDMASNSENHYYLQEFEVATSVFGKEVPALHSISLAIDSNLGGDYACLYRFRVHGEVE